MTVQDLEPAGLLDRPTEVDPLAQLPVVRGAVRPVGAGKGGDQGPDRLRACHGKHGHLVPQPREFPGQQPDQSLDAAAALLAHRGAER